MEKKNNRRMLFSAVAASTAGLILGSKASAVDPATAVVAGEIADKKALSTIAAAAAAIKKTMTEWKKSYDSFAKEANSNLSFIKTIDTSISDLQKLDETVRRKKEHLSKLSNKFQLGIKDPRSFRFPSIDPFTTDILDNLESRHRKLSKSYSNLSGKGKKGRAAKLKTLAKQDAQVNIGTAAARIQRNELEKLKKVAARNAKDNPQEDINAILTKASTPYVLETLQQLLEATRQNGELLSQILQTLDGNQINSSTASLTSITNSIKDVKEGRGTFIDDKGET